MATKPLKTIVCTAFALLAFAGNSILCRLALGDGTIDAASFTVIRLLSGILMLMIILMITSSNKEPVTKGSWLAGIMLFIYAITFSFSYISLDTGTGALILFGSVQLTMITASSISGSKLHYSEWLGVLLAFSGVIYLVKPSLSTPSLMGFLLMMCSGIAWGIYTLKGRTSKNPLSDTSYNFLRTLPLLLLVILFYFQEVNLSQTGVFLAMISGAITSGIGYAVWYFALRGLSMIQAGVLQLLVPVIAAIGGIIFAREIISIRLLLSSIMVLGGILLVLLGRYYFAQLTANKV